MFLTKDGMTLDRAARVHGQASLRTPGRTLPGGNNHLLHLQGRTAADPMIVVNVPVTARGETVREVATAGAEAQVLLLVAIAGQMVGTAEAGAALVEIIRRTFRTAGTRGRSLGKTGAGRKEKNLLAVAINWIAQRELTAEISRRGICLSALRNIFPASVLAFSYSQSLCTECGGGPPLYFM